MTKEEKQLLIKDLSARLPYGVYIKHISTGTIGKLNDISLLHYYNNTNSIQDIDAFIRFFGDDYTDIKTIKPYLRPMSSMTKEEKMYVNELIYDKDGLFLSPIPTWVIDECDIDKYIDFCNSKHLDWRGLISKGLALPAPEDMYDFK